MERIAIQGLYRRNFYSHLPFYKSKNTTNNVVIFSFKIMESLGKYLKTERERRNLSLEEAAKFTKIRIQFLRAIEEDRCELLLPSVYVKGFLTQYVRYLGLNPNEVILRYQEYQKSLNVKLPKVQPKIPLSKKRIIPWFFCMFNKFKKILVNFLLGS